MNIDDDKIKTYINLVCDDPDRERRVKLAQAAFRTNYVRNIDIVKENVCCLSGIVGTPENKEIHQKIINIPKKTTSSPNWNDAEILVEAHEAGLIYEKMIFVTADYHDILIHKEDIINCTSLHDIQFR